eukprot:GFYU01001722.1.p1 GENE.GFYU01001722.1~~GFYU01001722.1.p1  ORF type:complete len:752 (+),score=35.75 GFYU01001722.1:142-2397(+)
MILSVTLRPLVSGSHCPQRLCQKVTALCGTLLCLLLCLPINAYAHSLVRAKQHSHGMLVQNDQPESEVALLATQRSTVGTAPDPCWSAPKVEKMLKCYDALTTEGGESQLGAQFEDSVAAVRQERGILAEMLKHGPPDPTAEAEIEYIDSALRRVGKMREHQEKEKLPRMGQDIDSHVHGASLWLELFENVADPAQLLQLEDCNRLAKKAQGTDPEKAPGPDPLCVAIQKNHQKLLEARRLKDQHVVIVGAGPVGLLQAIRLFASGYDVQVFERREEFTQKHSPALNRHSNEILKLVGVVCNDRLLIRETQTLLWGHAQILGIDLRRPQSVIAIHNGFMWVREGKPDDSYMADFDDVSRIRYNYHCEQYLERSVCNSAVQHPFGDREIPRRVHCVWVHSCVPKYQDPPPPNATPIGLRDNTIIIGADGANSRMGEILQHYDRRCKQPRITAPDVPDTAVRAVHVFVKFNADALAQKLQKENAHHACDDYTREFQTHAGHLRASTPGTPVLPLGRRVAFVNPVSVGALEKICWVEITLAEAQVQTWYGTIRDPVELKAAVQNQSKQLKLRRAAELLDDINSGAARSLNVRDSEEEEEEAEFPLSGGDLKKVTLDVDFWVQNFRYRSKSWTVINHGRKNFLLMLAGDATRDSYFPFGSGIESAVARMWDGTEAIDLTFLKRAQKAIDEDAWEAGHSCDMMTRCLIDARNTPPENKIDRFIIAGEETERRQASPAFDIDWRVDKTHSGQCTSLP